MFTLYDYWRSSAAYRVRIALNLKGLEYRQVCVHLAKGGQQAEEYRALNAQGLVPMLAVEEDNERGQQSESALSRAHASDNMSRSGTITTFTQSLAIMEYLEETHPGPPLLPGEPEARARVRAMAQLIACDIHPLDNLRVLKYLTVEMGVSAERKDIWYAHWIAEGLKALEQVVKPYSSGRFCYGDTPTIADCCLMPQLYNARRFDCPLEDYPALTAIEQHCLTLPAFRKAIPENQPDAE